MASLEQARTAEAGGPAERLVLSPSPRGSEYADLSRRVRQAGLLDRRPPSQAPRLRRLPRPGHRRLARQHRPSADRPDRGVRDRLQAVLGPHPANLGRARVAQPLPDGRAACHRTRRGWLDGADPWRPRDPAAVRAWRQRPLGGLHAQGVAVVPAGQLRGALGADAVMSAEQVAVLADTAQARLHPAADRLQGVPSSLAGRWRMPMWPRVACVPVCCASPIDRVLGGPLTPGCGAVPPIVGHNWSDSGVQPVADPPRGGRFRVRLGRATMRPPAAVLRRRARTARTATLRGDHPGGRRPVLWSRS
jgi:hypothetical protein